MNRHGKILYRGNGNGSPMMPSVLFLHGQTHGKSQLLNLFASQNIYTKFVWDEGTYNDHRVYLTDLFNIK